MFFNKFKIWKAQRKVNTSAKKAAFAVNISSKLWDRMAHTAANVIYNWDKTVAFALKLKLNYGLLKWNSLLCALEVTETVIKTYKHVLWLNTHHPIPMVYLHLIKRYSLCPTMRQHSIQLSANVLKIYILLKFFWIPSKPSANCQYDVVN